MLLDRTTKMALDFCDTIDEKFGEKVDNFCVENVIDDASRRSFEIYFEAYNYFWIKMSYERGAFGWGICGGKYVIGLESTQKWYEKADFDVFFDEMKEEIESRIPDKFLKKHGWM